MNLFHVIAVLTTHCLFLCLAVASNDTNHKSQILETNYCDHGLVNSIVIRRIYKIQEKMRTEEPTLDPLNIPQINTTLAEDTFLAADLNVTDIRALHLSNFTITDIVSEIDLPVIRINISLDMEQLNITGAFHLKTKDVPWVPFFGDDDDEPVEARGLLYLQPTGMKVQLFLAINISDGSLQLQDLDYSVKASDFIIEFVHTQSLGFLVDQMINGVSSTMGPVIFEIGEDQVHEVLRNAISWFVTRILEESGFLRSVIWDGVTYNVDCIFGGWTVIVVVFNIFVTSLLVCIVTRRRRKRDKISKKDLETKVSLYTFPVNMYDLEKESDV